MSPIFIRLLLTVAIRILSRYRSQLTDEQKVAWTAAIKNMPTPDEKKAAEEATKPWYERKLEP